MRWKVWHPRSGVVYNELHEIKRGRYGPRRGLPPDARANGDGEKSMIQLALAGLRVCRRGWKRARHVMDEKSPPAGRYVHNLLSTQRGIL